MLYIDKVLFPVAPGKIVVETEMGNKTIRLADGSEASLKGGKGLRKISFEVLLPQTEYPFAQYENGFKDALYFAEELERIAKENNPVYFDVYKTFTDMSKTYLTSIRVLVEKLKITEDAENGFDLKAEIVLREYRSVKSKLAEEKKTETAQTRTDTFEIPQYHTVSSGECLWYIAKKYYDDSSMYTYLANINSIKYPYTIYVGQKLKLRE